MISPRFALAHVRVPEKFTMEEPEPPNHNPRAGEYSKIFPSLRFLVVIMLCLCFVGLSVSTSNLSVTMVCMVKKTHNDSHTKTCFKNNSTEPVDCDERVEWSSFQQGIVFAAQNFGSLTMLLTGAYADSLNGKWTITVALILLIVSNAMIPFVAHTSVWLVFGLRVLTGMGDAFLYPSSASMIGRWFPPKERAFAVGLVSGGRQIGSLLIYPVAGVLCEQSGQWPSIFYISSAISCVVLILWLLTSADKPSKHSCISPGETAYIRRKVDAENIGKRTERGRPPWKHILTSRPLIVGVATLVCHEYPLVIMLQLLPRFFCDVLHLSSLSGGIISMIPITVLWLSKTASSSLASFLMAKQLMRRNATCKLFNAIASFGLGCCMGITPFLASNDNPTPAIIVLCLANAFAGLHTPGVQTALVQLAPAYSGSITGLAFSVVSAFAIFNKLLANYILEHSSRLEWIIVFEISAVIAMLPVIFFSLWGSAERQWWASRGAPKEGDKSAMALASFSFYLTHQMEPS